MCDWWSPRWNFEGERQNLARELLTMLYLWNVWRDIHEPNVIKTERRWAIRSKLQKVGNMSHVLVTDMGIALLVTHRGLWTVPAYGSFEASILDLSHPWRFWESVVEVHWRPRIKRLGCEYDNIPHCISPRAILTGLMSYIPTCPFSRAMAFKLSSNFSSEKLIRKKTFRPHPDLLNQNL